eukprot:ctg_748.g265
MRLPGAWSDPSSLELLESRAPRHHLPHSSLPSRIAFVTFGGGTTRPYDRSAATCPHRRLPLPFRLEATLARIALTRERGKNVKLATALRSRWPHLSLHELPCIEHATTAELEHLRAHLQANRTPDDSTTEWILITSPEAAKVFLSVCPGTLRPYHRVAAVGGATADALRTGGIAPDFVPSKATGACLARELPVEEAARVLYPASVRASNDIETGLRARRPDLPFLRINAYDTVEAPWSELEWQRARHEVDVVTFASPSAVQVWAARIGVQQAAACIGETSAQAASRGGFTRVYCPEAPGMDGWIGAIEQAMAQLQKPERSGP